MILSSENSDNSRYLSKKEIISYGLGQFAIALGGLGSAQYLSYYWTDIALIPLTAVSIIMLSSRIFDGLNDILIAWMVDRTSTKFGKARPWILWFFIPATIVNIGLFYSPGGSIYNKIIWAVLTYNLVNLLFSTCCMIPIQALTSLISQKSKERITLSFAGQIAFVFAQILGALTFVKCTMLLGGAQKGYFYYFSICAILAGISMFATFLGAEEKIKPIKSDKKLPFGQALKMTLHNKWWLISMGLQLGVFSLITLQSVSMYYVTYIIGNMNLLTLIMSITFVSQFIMPFIFKPVVDKLGKIKATGISLLIASVGFLIPLIDMTSITLLVAASVFRGLGISGSSTTRCAITADVVDYGEWKTSHRLDAIIFSGNSIAAKVGMGLSGMLIMLILNASGYIGGTATQTPEALSSIVFMYTWLNVIIIGISSIFLLALHSLEQEMENIQKDLTQREILINEPKYI